MTLPRRWAVVPLLVGCCYMTVGQGISLGSFSLPLYRMLIGVGLLRIMIRGERIVGSLNSADKLILLWGVWIMVASLFHERAPGSGPEYASGLVFNILGAYFLIRTWTEGIEGVVAISGILAVLLAPVALEMMSEKFTGKNMFSIFGGVSGDVGSRGGEFRAQGPFRHPILAGTVGATCFPMFVGLWNYRRSLSVVGMAAAGSMVMASGSSGPMMSCIVGIVALAMWRYRGSMSKIRWAAVGIYLLMELVMSRPAYYIIEKGDLTGKSTGWHRAALIEASITNFSDWWRFGTDYTRHWMASGTTFNPNHVDVTNYYLMFGVVAGLPAVLLLIAILWKSFRRVGEAIGDSDEPSDSEMFFAWCLGASLFAHAVTSISVAYFDQSMLFFWATIAIIGSIHQRETEAEEHEMEEAGADEPGSRMPDMNAPAWKRS